MLTLNKKHEQWWYLIISVLAFFSFYFALGAYPLFDNNEGLYASIAKLMLLQKEFIIPHLNCVPYIEKPPLLYWLLSGSFSLFGFTAFAARLVTATSATLICAAIVFFTKKIKQPQIGIIGALIFTSSIGISIIARMVYFDMLFTLLITCTLFCMFYWYESQKVSALRISYVFLGLAILTKGLVAIILIGGSFSLFLILERNFHKFYKALDPVGIALFLATVLPWHMAAIMQHQDFFRHYIIEEHFLRFLNQREPHDYYNGPIYYYLPRIIIYLLPWSLFAPLIFWRTKNTDTVEKRLLRLGWCWLLVPLIFFSISSAKANYYMVVSAPALAIILGIKIYNLFTKYSPKIFCLWSVAILLSTALALSVGYFNFLHDKIVIIAIAYTLIVATTALFMIRHPDVIVALVASLIVPLAIIMISYIKTIQNNLSTEGAGTYLSSVAKGEPLYIYQDFEKFSALAFYAPRCLKIIDSKSNDLYYGKSLPESKQWFVDKKELLHDATKHQVYIIVPNKKLEQFYQEMKTGKFYPQQEFNTAIIVSNRKS